MSRLINKYERKKPSEHFKNFDEILYKFKKLNEYNDVIIHQWFTEPLI